MKDIDLVFSLGSTCQNAWNLRSYFAFDRAYPFDWWVTPAKSMLKMIEPGFQFNVARGDLHITPTNEHNTVYNYNLNLLHHHDFPRRWGKYPGVVFSVTDADIEKINSNYKGLFARLVEDVKNASNPVAVLNGSYSGWPTDCRGIPTNPSLNGFIPTAELAREVRDRLGKNLRLAFISVGETTSEEHEWGWNICLPDLGTRENTKAPAYAEPIHVFRQAYEQLDFSLIQKQEEELADLPYDIKVNWR
jgi:hypothetical protein